MSQKRKNMNLYGKGKAKTSAPKKKESTTKNKEVKDRPPTRRNRNEALSIDTVQNTAICRSESPLSKFQTSAAPANAMSTLMDMGEHQYLQFSLRITEEIITNDLYTNDEMIHVVKHHYMANRNRLDQDKLLRAIKELCLQLNIPFDENLLQYLNDDCGENVFPTIPQTDNDCKNSNNPSRASSPNSNRSVYQPEVPPSPNQNVCMSDQQMQVEIPIIHPCLQEDVLSDTTTINSTGKGLPTYEADTTLKQQPNLITDEEYTVAKETLKTDKMDGELYPIKVIRSATLMEDLSKSFEFGEEILMSFGEVGKPLVSGRLVLKEGRTKQDFKVLHDGTAKFVMDSDKESDFSINGVTSLSSYTKTVKIPKEPIKKEKNLVVVHYVTSLEPTNALTTEFSTQVSMSSIRTKPGSPQYIQTVNGSTQHNIPLSSEINLNAMDIGKSTREFNVNGSYKRCNCCKEGDNYLKSSDLQFVLLDCPLMLTRERTKSMGFLNSLRNIPEHTVNLVLPPNQYETEGSLNTLGSAGGIPSPGKYEINYGDYDMTPQKDAQQTTATTAKSPRPISTQELKGCVSCTSASLDSKRTERLNRYKKVSDNLSFFYPTIATQVSSMDLLSTEILGHARKEQRAKELQAKEKQDRVLTLQFQSQQPSLHNQHQQYTPPNEPNLDYWNRQERPARQEKPKVIEKPPEPIKVDTCCGNSIQEIPSVSGCPSESRSERTPKPERRTPLSRGNRVKINVDDNVYRFENKIEHRLDKQELLKPAGHKRPYVQDIPADKDISKRSSKSHHKTYHSPLASSRATEKDRSLEDEVSIDRMPCPYSSTDSMEKRIKSLRQDIEKYSRDDESSKRMGESSKRNEVLGILRQKSLNEELPEEGLSLKKVLKK